MQVNDALAGLEEAAEKARRWLLSERPKPANITVTTMRGFLRLVEAATGIAPPGDRHWPHLARLAERCESEPAFAACFPPETERPLPPGFSAA